jgi:hypothetical protein
MISCKPFFCILALCLISLPASAQQAAKQCEMISAMTGDYYAQRQAGKAKQEMQEALPPAFADSEFERTATLAINLAFNVDASLNEDQVETRVFDSCMQHQQ